NSGLYRLRYNLSYLYSLFFAFSLKLFNTFSGLLIMPHAPFLIICIEERLSPFAMWTAFPSSDYYGDSVAIVNIQSHFSHSTHSRFSAFYLRQSPFRTVIT